MSPSVKHLYRVTLVAKHESTGGLVVQEYDERNKRWALERFLSREDVIDIIESGMSCRFTVEKLDA